MSDDRSRPGSVYLSQRDWDWLKQTHRREGYRSVSSYVASMVRLPLCQRLCGCDGWDAPTLG
jgi:hypothetical protein